MISVSIRRKRGRIWAFTVTDHGKTDVCAAVSLLTLNTVNSIEALTGTHFTCEYDPEGGFLQFEIKEYNPKTDLLLEAMALGLESVKENYGNDIILTNEEVN